MMELKNMKVIHNTFGEGTVVSVDGNQVHIDFGNYGIKDFVYPDIFATYVKLQDPAVQVVIDKEIIAVKIANIRYINCFSVFYKHNFGVIIHCINRYNMIITVRISVNICGFRLSLIR